MAQQPKEERKLDLSNLPRGAISIKGLPVSRNTRLPSIRSPRDLTLGAPPKRTFMPNIPVRRERKSQIPESGSQTNQETVKIEKMGSPHSEKSRGRYRGKSQIIQTQGAIFSEGIAADPSFKKERTREPYQKSDYPASSRGIFLKKEKADNDDGISPKMDRLLRDDFIDDDDDNDNEVLLKPTVFPLPAQVKKEPKDEGAGPQLATDFDPNIAKEMGFDVNRIAKFIKKEKGGESEENMINVPAEMSPNEIASLLNIDANSSKLFLIQFPEFLNLDQKMDDPGPPSSNADSKISDDQNINSSSIKSLPQGFIGKLQVLKSGKTRLFIGSMEFSLESKNPLQTKHEVVSINTDSSTGDLSVLGYLHQKLKFIPDEDCLLV